MSITNLDNCQSDSDHYQCVLRVAVRAMPEFMTNLRAACLKLRGGVGSSKLLNPDLFRKEAVRRGFTMLDVDNNPDVDPVPDELISKGDASYESAWIDKLLGNSDAEDDEPGQVASEARGQSRHNSCQPDISRQDNASRGIFLFCMFLFWFRIPPLN